MKRINTYYWILTALLIPSLGIGSIMEILGKQQSVEIITSLGYPAYLSAFLGVARILALLAIFVPKFQRLKEWAYAGLVFDVIGAIYSQIAVGNPFTYNLFPMLILGIILGSYFLHHKRISNKPGVQEHDNAFI